MITTQGGVGVAIEVGCKCGRANCSSNMDFSIPPHMTRARVWDMLLSLITGNQTSIFVSIK